MIARKRARIISGGDGLFLSRLEAHVERAQYLLQRGDPLAHVFLVAGDPLIGFLSQLASLRVGALHVRRNLLGGVFREYRRGQALVADTNHGIEGMGAGLERTALTGGQLICQKSLRKSKL